MRRAFFFCKILTETHYAHNADRLYYPLKKVGDRHERITWEQAIREISGKLLAIKEKHFPPFNEDVRPLRGQWE